MLVLSRRAEEKILLPTVPAVIKIISSQAGLVRLGIEAPSHVPILREELARQVQPAAPAAQADPLDAQTLRQRLNNLNLGVSLLRMQLEGAVPTVRRTLDGMEQELLALRRLLGSEAGEPLTPALA